MSKRSLAIAAAGVGGGSDPQFKNVSLLLQGDVSNPDLTYNAFSDASTNNFPIASYGETYGSSFSPYNTSWSNHFDGSGDYLELPQNNANAISGDGTIEAWIFLKSYNTTDGYATSTVICNSNGGSASTIQWTGFGVYGNYLQGALSLSSRNYEVSSAAGVIPLNTWTHIAAVKSGSTVTLYKNGTSVASGTFNETIFPNTSGWSLRVGHWLYSSGANRYFDGYISNLRVVNGTALYTSSFTPSTTPLTAVSGTSLLTCQSNRFKDNSSNNFAITKNGDVSVKSFSPFADTDTITGSGYFDGTGDYLTVADNAAFEIGANNFTLECWVYPTATGDYTFLGKYNEVASTSEYIMELSSNQVIIWIYYASSYFSFNSGSSLVTTNAWNHIALSRNGSSWAIFVNGVRGGTATQSVTVADRSVAFSIGAGAGGQYPLPGYISNVRLVNGSYIYDPAQTTITVPTSPLTTVSGTSILTLQTRGATQNIGFIDSSANKFPITKYGNATQGTFSPYGSLWSNYFDGDTDWLTVSASAGLNIYNSIFTLECWIYYIPNTSDQFICLYYPNTTSSWDLYIQNSDNKLVFRYNTYTTGFTSSGVITPNQWSHIAIVYDGSATKMYINGVLNGSVNSAVLSPNGSYTLDIGRNGWTNYGSAPNGSGFYKGYIEDFRIVKGTAVYTGNFTPPTTPLTAIAGTSLLTCQSNRFKDSSTNNLTITASGNTSVKRFSPFNPTTAYSTSAIGGSAYFDGNEDYLTVPNNAVFNFGSGNFTVEFWINAPSIPDLALSVFGAWPASGSTGWMAYITSTSFVFYVNGSTQILSISNTFQFNAWNHYAVVRNGNAWTVYLNGTSIGSTSAGTAIADTAANLYIGINGANNRNDVIGYVSDVRVVKGTAVYTGNFTPPTTPLTAIAGTSLLCNFTNAGIQDSVMQNDIESVGNAQVSTSVKKYGTGSLAFDGTGDYLVMPITPNLYLGSGNFTIEAWVYVTLHHDYNFIYSYGPPVEFYMRSSGAVGLFLNDTDDTTSPIISIETPTAVSLNTWTHVAAVRNGSSFVVYINGVSSATGTSSSAVANSATRPCVGDYAATGGTGYAFNGYIDDLRITKGYARYTANFTPPAQSLPKQ